MAQSIPAPDVIAVLETLRCERGLPAVLITDNGSEFTSRAFDASESCNGTFRDDCLNLPWFTSSDGARVTIEAWRNEYNHVRPHGSLGELTPAEFVVATTEERNHALQPERVQE